MERLKSALKKHGIDCTPLQKAYEAAFRTQGTLGMILHKMSLITIFGHKHFRLKFHQKFESFHKKNFNNLWFGSYFLWNCKFWSIIASKLRDKFWKKWQLWPKNVITQIFQRPYNLISILATDASGCTHVTHRCHHAAHAYTGMPCMAPPRRKFFFFNCSNLA